MPLTWKLTLFSKYNEKSSSVNVEIFVQYIFSRISHRAVGARNYDVIEKYEIL